MWKTLTVREALVVGRQDVGPSWLVMNVPAREDSSVEVRFEEGTSGRRGATLDNCSSSSRILSLSTSGSELEVTGWAVNLFVATGAWASGLVASTLEEAFDECPEPTVVEVVEAPLAEGVGNGGTVMNGSEPGTYRTTGLLRWTRLVGAWSFGVSQAAASGRGTCDGGIG